MAKLPRQPDMERLRETPPSLITIGPNLLLHRIYKRGGNYPTLWNTFRNFGPISRFDHHLPNENNEPEWQDRGVLYAATDIPTAIAETFQLNRRRINRFRDLPWLASFSLPGELQLLNLTDTFCVRAGGSMKLVSGPFQYAQRWSQGFYEAYPDIAGLYYPSSLTNRPSIVLFERANSTDLFPNSTRMHRELANPVLHKPLSIVAQEIGFRLI